MNNLSSPPIEDADRTLVERTRSAVLNVMVVEGAAIAVSGWVLGRLDRGALSTDPVMAWRLAVAALFAILLFSRVVLRVGGGRAALHDPAHRAGRFYRSHLISAGLGALAIPLGFLYGWGVEPTLQSIAPFWIVGLAVGFLALPKMIELEGFDEPMPSPNRADDAESEVQA